MERKLIPPTHDILHTYIVLKYILVHLDLISYFLQLIDLLFSSANWSNQSSFPPEILIQ